MPVQQVQRSACTGVVYLFGGSFQLTWPANISCDRFAAPGLCCSASHVVLFLRLMTIVVADGARQKPPCTASSMQYVVH